MVVYFILKGGSLRFTTTHPEAFNYYDDYWVNMMGSLNGIMKRVIKNATAQKAQIKKELMRVARHPSRYWDWCVPEGEKKEIGKLWR